MQELGNIVCRQGAAALKGSVCVVAVGHWRGILSRKELDISGSVSRALSAGVWVQCQAWECISEAWGQRGGQVTSVCVCPHAASKASATSLCSRQVVGPGTQFVADLKGG